MEFEVFIETIFAMLRDSESAAFAVGCVVVCILSLVVKKLFVSKLETQLFNKFDISIFIPFVLGILAAICIFLLSGKEFLGADTVYLMLIDSLSIGTAATVLQKLCTMFISTDLKKLLKDDAFSTIFHEVMLLSSAKQKLISKELTLKDFLAKIISIKEKSLSLYSDVSTDDGQKLEGLTETIKDLFEEETLAIAAESLHVALSELTKKD